MESYDTKHWEELIGVIIDRLGIDRFVEMVAYVADEKGYAQLAERLGRLEHLAAAMRDHERRIALHNSILDDEKQRAD